MKRSPIHYASRLLALTLVLWMTSCTRAAPLDTTIKKWSGAGWTHMETFGNVREDAVEASHETSSPTAPVRAHWNSPSTNHEKHLAQDANEYLVVTMKNKMGESYAVIFKRKAP